MLHNEARKLLVEAYEKSHDAKEVARMFSVAKSEVYKLAHQMKTTGSVELQTSKRGRTSSLTEQNLKDIEALILEQSDITIDEIIEKLQLKVCNETVRMAVIKMGFTYKKKSMHASERERARCSGKA